MYPVKHPPPSLAVKLMGQHAHVVELEHTVVTCRLQGAERVAFGFAAIACTVPFHHDRSI